MTDAEARSEILGLSTDDLGLFGEAIWQNVLSSSDIFYVPLCRIETGSAPMAKRKSQAIVLPDFDVASVGKTMYLDSKVKTRSVWYFNASQERHGIDEKNWTAYSDSGTIYRKDAGIGIVELLRHDNRWSGSLLIERFVGLGKPFRGFNSQEHMVYWRREAFFILDSFSPTRLRDMATGKPSRNYSDQLHEALFSDPPLPLPPPPKQTKLLEIQKSLFP